MAINEDLDTEENWKQNAICIRAGGAGHDFPNGSR